MVAVRYFALAVFSHIGFYNVAAEHKSSQLHSVTNAEHRNAEIKYFGINLWRVRIVYVARSARKDYTFRVVTFNFFNRGIGRNHNGVNVKVSYSPYYKLIVLPAEVHYENHLMFH